jgi:dinuclear metal center YbgI/SA1388 family protein
MKRNDLTSYLTQLLKPQDFNDYAPNGLQIEGAQEIKKIITGVTACQALIDAAIERKADTVLVHHGYFWNGEPPEITGIKRARIKKLLENNINLIGYHLPLDAHPQYGNNVQLAEILGWDVTSTLDAPVGKGIVFASEFSKPIKADTLAKHIEEKLGRKPLHIPSKKQDIKTIAWCTGGAQDYIQHAIDHNIDAFLTGEVSERTFHIAQENNLDFFAAGHHATERYGIKALGEHLAHEFSLDVEFVDINNPV